MSSLEMRISWQEELFESFWRFYAKTLTNPFSRNSNRSTIFVAELWKNRLRNYQHPHFSQYRYAGKCWKKLSRDAHIFTGRTSWIFLTFSVWKLWPIFSQEMSTHLQYLLLRVQEKFILFKKVGPKKSICGFPTISVIYISKFAISVNESSRDGHILTGRTSWILLYFFVSKLWPILPQEMSTDPQ